MRVTTGTSTPSVALTTSHLRRERRATMNLDMLPKRLTPTRKKRVKDLSLDTLAILPLAALLSVVTVIGLLATFA